MEKRDALSKLQAISNIIAAILIPALIAYFGYMAQTKQAEEKSGQEFVRMALNILADTSENSNPELRKWAIKIIDVKAPIPMTKGLKGALEKGDIEISTYLEPPKNLEFVITPDQ